MKRAIRLSVFCALTWCVSFPAFGQPEAAAKPSHQWWNEPFPFRFRGPRSNQGLPRIQVRGNRFVSVKGDTILFRGLAVSDPDKLANQGHWDRHYFEKVKEMGAMLVRIPVHPVAWRERTPAKYLELLDQAVAWCTDLGLYVAIDWHSIGNLQAELFQNAMYETTKKETFDFWRMTAGRFSGNSTVAFYELFNEPTHYQGRLGSMSWSEWKRINEDLIRMIRSTDRETIPLVAGFDWAYDLGPVRYEPIEAEGIGYVTHPYAHKRSQPWEPKWDENFGFAADRYPVVATEFGLGVEKGKTVGPEDYGSVIIRYLERRKISWIGWVFDADWHPALLQSWDTYELTGAGEFFKQALHGGVK
jgi:endoglucanase